MVYISSNTHTQNNTRTHNNTHTKQHTHTHTHTKTHTLSVRVEVEGICSLRVDPKPIQVEPFVRIRAHHI